MSRQKKKKGIVPWLLLAVVAVGAGGYFVLRQQIGGGAMRTVEPLDPALYYDNANSLRGNTYKIDAEIDSSLGNSPSKGRLFSVTLKGATQGTAVVLPVLIPTDLGSLTVQKGQHYLMKVKVVDGGLLKVEEAWKP